MRGNVHVVDVFDINAPRKVAEYPLPEAEAHNMWVEDDIMSGLLQRRRSHR